MHVSTPHLCWRFRFFAFISLLSGFPSAILFAADITYPAQPVISKDGMTVLLENYANAPFSSRTVTTYPPPINFSDQLSRINFMRPEPSDAPGFGNRFFVCDLNRNLYIVPKTDPLETNTWIPYLNFETIFPKFDNDPGYAGGLATFAFDPGYSSNGLFYTVHMEGTGSTVGPTNGAYPELDLSGYATTGAINPPSGGVGRIAVLIEWKDSNITNTTFEGTAREILRIGFAGTIHPLGDLSFNPAATNGHPDFRNLYLAVGDGRAGEANTSTHPHPQRLDTLVGKILRITPDVQLRPGDQLSGNGRYRIPTTGPDPNPFAAASGTFTNLPNARKEIFAYGFRNPHRMSWDVESDSLFVNDIGFHSWEEVNRIHKGANYGWAGREGPEEFFVTNGVTGSRLNPVAPFTDDDSLLIAGISSPVSPTYPVACYSHRDGDAISSGFVYRGTLMPELYGKYVFGDITTARLFYCDLDEILAVDDGVRTTLAEIREIQIAFDSPYDFPDQGVTNRRLFDIVSETYKQKGGNNSNALPGSADVTNGSDPSGKPYGRGRADIRLAIGDDNELYVISKSDASIRKMAATLGPPTIQAFEVVEGDVTIQWRSFPGRNYRVQSMTSFEVEEWSDASEVLVADGLSASTTIPVEGDQRFFRVILLP